MNQRDIDAMMKSIAPIISGFVIKATEPLISRVVELEKREPPKDGKDGSPGLDGKDGLRGSDGSDGLHGKDGIDGKDGINGEPGKDGVEGLRGADGADGLHGKDGVDGKDGIDGKDGADGIRGADGADGLHGNDGKDGVDGKDGEPGINGKDGVDGKDGTDGTSGRDGIDGKEGTKGMDGRDGRDASDLNVIRGMADEEVFKALSAMLSTANLSTPDDGRTILLQFNHGQVIVKTEAKLATVLDRGVWKEASYEKGDGVTYAGSFFIAQNETTSADKPGQSDRWRLAVKRGRDGADGKVRDTTPKTVKV